jgi:ribonucleoside-diphosphate reductase alpha chain
MMENIDNTKAFLADTLMRVTHKLAAVSQKTDTPMTEEALGELLERCLQALTAEEANRLAVIADATMNQAAQNQRPEVVEVRPRELECDVVRFQNNKEKWVALVGLLDGYPYEIFTGLQDDDEGIILPKSVTKGKIVKQVNEDGSKRYDFQFENKRGYKTTVEGLSEKFNPEYWNYAKLISGVLRYRMPIGHVIKLVSSLQLQSESINTWKVGVERALKKYE